ncbi:signal peptidase II [Labrys sp. KNU-23]|uniref:signal peptidase II n=1 Tax=Labrys sp. KNU-23 TaxID=2789216 RepID=UPI0011EF8B28|nr:signal peptidase II [Labrys sp. KNU-23]QEN89841.1 signal peptidase II [Labrys sp. KNU-23]
MKSWFIGRHSFLGVVAAILAVAIDQGQKYWALYIHDIANSGPVDWTPNLQFVLVWNRGVSYGMFQQETEFGRWALISFRIAAVVLLLAWLARISTKIGAVAIGLIIGGALGNAIDGVLYGAVADFFLLHAGDFSWYVFNLADVAIVAGVVLLLYDMVVNKEPQTHGSS